MGTITSAMAAILQFESQVVTKLLHNSWIDATEEHFQSKVLAAALSRTPKRMIKLDGQMLLIHQRIKQKKLRLFGKVMVSQMEIYVRTPLKWVF